MWNSARLQGKETGREKAERSGHPRDLDGHPPELVNTWFAELDADGSGFLEQAEIKQLLQRLREPSYPDALVRAMRELDTDGSGQVSQDEFAGWYRRRLKAMDDQIMELQQSMVKPVSAATAKFKATKQPGWDSSGYTNTQFSSGAPRIPPPHCTFPPRKVKLIQELFMQLGGDDQVMSPLEWQRCLHAAGVSYNPAVSERLFKMFDTSGDLEMSAKEFSWGLSDICNEAAHPGSTMSGHTQPKTPDEVRRAFAYRFYDEDVSGFLDKHDFHKFLLSWKEAADHSIDKACKQLLHVYGLGEEPAARQHGLVSFRLPSPNETAKLQEIDAEIVKQLDRVCTQIFKFFTGEFGKRMNYAQFTNFTKEARQSMDWLTQLGKDLDAQFSAHSPLIGMTFDQADAADADATSVVDTKATELSQARMRTTYRAYSKLNIMGSQEFERFLRKALGLRNSHLAQRLFAIGDANQNRSLTQDEFIAWMTKLVHGAPEERRDIAFCLIDERRHGYVDQRAMRRYFHAWFATSLAEVEQLATQVDAWINGKVVQLPRSTTERRGGLSPDRFGYDKVSGISDRKLNLEIASNIRKKAAGAVGMLVEQLVAHAMEYAQPPPANLSGVRKQQPQLKKAEFEEWMSAHPHFTDWLSSLGHRAGWLVTPAVYELENAPSAGVRASVFCS